METFIVASFFGVSIVASADNLCLTGEKNVTCWATITNDDVQIKTKIDVTDTCNHKHNHALAVNIS